MRENIFIDIVTPWSKINIWSYWQLLKIFLVQQEYKIKSLNLKESEKVPNLELQRYKVRLPGRVVFSNYPLKLR